MSWTPRRTYLKHLHYAIQNGYYVGYHSGKTLCGIRVQRQEFTLSTRETDCDLCKYIFKESRKIAQRVSKFRCISWNA